MKRLKKYFSGDPDPETESPRHFVLSVEQIEAELLAHRWGGSVLCAGGRYTLCYCGNRLPESDEALRRHQAEEIVKLQK